MLVIRIKSHVASSLLPLSEVSKQIEDKLKVQEAKRRADKFAEDISREIAIRF